MTTLPFLVLAVLNGSNSERTPILLDLFQDRHSHDAFGSGRDRVHVAASGADAKRTLGVGGELQRAVDARQARAGIVGVQFERSAHRFSEVVALNRHTSSIPQNPRLFVHQHTPYSDLPRLRRELDLAVELGFGGIRTEWGALQMLNADGSFGGTWAQLKVIDPFLAELKARNLGLHVTFGERSAFTLDQEAVFYRYVMAKSVEVLGASKVSWSVANEPRSWWDKKLDAYDAARGRLLVGIWDSMGVRDQGAWLYSGTWPGWFYFDTARPLVMTTEIHDTLSGIEWGYRQDFYRLGYLQRVGCAFHVYAPAWNYDASLYAREKGRTISEVVGTRLISHPQAVTEFNVRYSPSVSRYMHGKKWAVMAVELLKIERLRFATAYCLAGHENFAFASAEGVRDSERIRGWKAVFK